MRVAIVTAGAAGMICGSCLNDNTLARALVGLGHDALLVPTYTPITTDNPDASLKRVFMGGVRIYLEQKYGWFRALPRWSTAWLDSRPILNLAGKFAGMTNYSSLGELTLSLLAGDHGPHKQEMKSLIDFLADEVQPDLVHFSNALISGIIPMLRERLRCPIVVELQGDDIFLEGLLPVHRTRAIEAIRSNCSEVDRFHATATDYSRYMAEYLGIGSNRFRAIHPGIDLAGFPDLPHRRKAGQPLRLGYFARICPEKGLDTLIDAWLLLRQRPGLENLVLQVGGWLGGANIGYWRKQIAKVHQAGQSAGFLHRPSPTLADKLAFLADCDLFSVPARMREPKGIYLLEAWAHGIPAIQPAYGSFPELIEATGGGILVERESPASLADGIERLARDETLAAQLGAAGFAAVRRDFDAGRMARETLQSYQEIS